MVELNYDLVFEGCHAGGSSALVERTQLAPAAGDGALVAPAKYLSKGGSSTYVYEMRPFAGEALNTVLIDSRTSSANRLEDALVRAIDDGHELLGRIPRVRVTYSQADPAVSFTDMEMPHRLFDGHIRLGTHDGEAVTSEAVYRRARNSSPANAWDILQLSPDTVIFGGWDSTRRARQARFAAVTVGEIYGVLADQDSARPSPSKRSGARIDPMAPSFVISPAQAKEMAASLGDDVSARVKKATKGSDFLIGAIPPGTDAFDGIATREIVRSRVLSFSTLRSLRFGKGAEGDAAIRTLLASIVLSAMARANSELLLRANAHLVEKAAPSLTIDRRFGESAELEPLTIEATDALLEQSFAKAEQEAGINWNGQIYEVEGNPTLPASADATKDE